LNFETLSAIDLKRSSVVPSGERMISCFMSIFSPCDCWYFTAEYASFKMA
jgi:hypothetical protein